MYVCDRLLEPDKSGVLSGLPVHVSNIHSILQQVESAEICAGNPDNDFVSLIEREGGGNEQGDRSNARRHLQRKGK